MASPCELLIETGDAALARRLLEHADAEAQRIDRKFSRYRDDSLVHAINTSGGRAVTVDEETARLIDYGEALWRLSEGRFDLTSGVLRYAWTFDEGPVRADPARIPALLERIGWHRVQWQRPVLTMPAGMEIDFGGIGKEYAVDAAAKLADQVAPGLSCLINFGGDVAVRNARQLDEPWRVGIESLVRTGSAERVVKLSRGALATSGDSRRFVIHDGHRYSHILDARTGWPVRNAPHSITVAADTCTQAGTLTTLAMLQGEKAEQMLRESGLQYWLQ